VMDVESAKLVNGEMACEHDAVPEERITEIRRSIGNYLQLVVE